MAYCNPSAYSRSTAWSISSNGCSLRSAVASTGRRRSSTPASRAGIGSAPFSHRSPSMARAWRSVASHPTVRPLAAFVDAAGVGLLRAVIDARCNIVVSGATSSGKTSLVAALLATVPGTERLIVVEDTTELPIEHPHLVRLEARPATIDGPPAIEVADLVRTALRLRPDRIVVGEVRGHEALALVQAMNTGHDGSISTCHANSPLDALLRLETLVLQASPSWPLHSIRLQLARSIDIVVHIERAGILRRISAICEVVERSGEPMLQPLGRLRSDGSFERVATCTRTRR